MFEDLMASLVPSERPIRSTVVSLISHAGLLTVAVLVTRGAVVATPASPPLPRELPYLGRVAATPPAATASQQTHLVGTSPAFPEVPVIVPVGLPPLRHDNRAGPPPSASAGLPDHDPFTPQGNPLYPPPRDSVHAQGEVDEPVQRLSGPAPVYPPALRAAGIEGFVRLTMVIDTMGRVEPASIRILQSTHEAFESAARHAMQGARFTPARVAGAAVRQLVQQSVRFAIEE